ncbi:MAG: putative transcriptional regulator [Cocleimonas sp.]|jgi:putative transcriptional regulator
MQDQKLTEKKLREQNLTEKNKGASNKVLGKKAVDHSYLQSQLLIAMPGLEDPYFKQSVTLICQHNEDGCFGLTINKPIAITVDEILNQLNIDSEISLANPAKIKYTQLNKSVSPKSLAAVRGGPVQAEQGFVIHDGDKKWENTMDVLDDEGGSLSVTVSRDILLDIAIGNGPENYLFTLGCASWEARQVEDEIINNSWLNCSFDRKILFEMPFEDRWQGAADTLGINLHAMSGISGHD